MAELWFTIKNYFYAALFHYGGFVGGYDQPGKPWEFHPDAAAAGFEAAELLEVEETLQSMPTDGLVVIVDGKIAWEYGDTTQLSYLASVRKSVLALLYGPYVADDTIDLDLTLEELGMDEPTGLMPIERQATVRHLLQARSGVYHPASNPGDNLASAPPRGSQQPGDYYLYSNWDFNAAGGAFELMTGENIYDAFGEKLAGPLGFEHWIRLIHMKSGDTDRSRYQAYHMVFSTRDMARLGELMLRDGNWQGEQVVPADWVQEIRSLSTPNADMNPAEHREGEFGYGYMWWVWDGPKVECVFEGAYTGQGAFGQYITVVPKLDMVVAHKTVPDDRTAYDDYRSVMGGLVRARTDLERETGCQRDEA